MHGFRKDHAAYFVNTVINIFLFVCYRLCILAYITTIHILNPHVSALVKFLGTVVGCGLILLNIGILERLVVRDVLTKPTSKFVPEYDFMDR